MVARAEHAIMSHEAERQAIEATVAVAAGLICLARSRCS
jgi:hypothetical protein